MIKEFKDFIAKGNVIDLAVAVVLGATFGAVVVSFTNDILMQILAIFVGKPDFGDLTLTIRDAEIYWGSFLTALINFLLIGLALFVVVKGVNKMQNLRSKEEEQALEMTEIDLLIQIRDALVQRSD